MTERGFTSHSRPRLLCMHTMTAMKIPRAYIYLWCPVLLVKPYPSHIRCSRPAVGHCLWFWGIVVFFPGGGGLIQIPLNTSIHLSTWSVCTLCKGQQRNAESQVLRVNTQSLSQKSELGSLVNPLSFTHYRGQANIC